MRNTWLIVTAVAAAAVFGCQKQQTEEERRAEVERQVQERLTAERQQQQLSQRESELNAREQALNERERQADTSAPSTPAREAASGPTTDADQDRVASYSLFYTKLEGYGDWIETDDYGYVFRPRETADARWRPYTNGHWVYTDAGWTWISDEPFGWATYHYGRWTRIRGVGWVWVPETEWGPAWVSWREGDGYVGWAPLPPEAQFDRRTGIRNWSDSYYEVGPDQYVFVSTTEFGEERLNRVVVPEQRNITIINQTTNVTNITYNNSIIVNQGPSYDRLRSHTRRPINRLRLQRQATVQAQNPRPVIHGDMIEIPAPVIQNRVVAKPPLVKQTIKRPMVDLGWDAVAGQPEAKQVRTKLQSEATPPPNVPPKKFVKRAETGPSVSGNSGPATTRSPEASTRQPVAQSNPGASASASPVTAREITPGPTPSASPEVPSQAAASATPRTSATLSPQSGGALSPREIMRATASPSSSVAPMQNESASPAKAAPRVPSTPSRSAPARPLTTPEPSSGRETVPPAERSAVLPSAPAMRPAVTPRDRARSVSGEVTSPTPTIASELAESPARTTGTPASAVTESPPPKTVRQVAPGPRGQSKQRPEGASRPAAQPSASPSPSASE